MSVEISYFKRIFQLLTLYRTRRGKLTQNNENKITCTEELLAHFKTSRCCLPGSTELTQDSHVSARDTEGGPSHL